MSRYSRVILVLVMLIFYQTVFAKYRHSRQIFFQSEDDEFVGRGLLQNFAQGN